MSHPLPRLRLGLDFLPSRDPEQPGLVIRDPYRFSDSMLLIPPPIVQSLACFDGEQTALDLRASLVRATGEIQVGALEKNLIEALSNAGFLEDENFSRMSEARQREFYEAEKREPSHAGSAYPDEADEATRELNGFFEGHSRTPPVDLLGIAAPHVSPFGGWQSYAKAYNVLSPADRGRTFVILGTSHYGESERFGLTRKPFVTPLGEAKTNAALVDELERRAPGAVLMEDYCHAIEHSIEFQVLFLQHVVGPEVSIVPVLCGAYGKSLYKGGMPEDDANVGRFIDALGEIRAREGNRLCWVLGIDMAHMGRRYGDEFSARANESQMNSVARRDTERIDALNSGDAAGFWKQVQENHDDLKWCGAAPIYTFLKAIPQARGSLERYEQWNIDEQSVVSFAAIQFRDSSR